MASAVPDLACGMVVPMSMAAIEPRETSADVHMLPSTGEQCVRLGPE